MSDKEIKEGDQVSWQWSGSRPGGTVSEIAKEGELSIETKKGNEVKKNADPEDPAVKISRSGNNVVKRAHELDVEKEGDKHKEDQGEEKTVTKDDTQDKDDETKDKNGDDKEEKADGEEKEEDEEEEKEDDEEEEKESDEKKQDGEAKTGDKREAGDEQEDEGRSKKKKKQQQQKTDETGEENGDKKKRGRPVKNGNEASASKPKKEPKKAATASGEPRRSSRLNSS